MLLLLVTAQGLQTQPNACFWWRNMFLFSWTKRTLVRQTQDISSSEEQQLEAGHLPTLYFSDVRPEWEQELHGYLEAWDNQVAKRQFSKMVDHSVGEYGTSPSFHQALEKWIQANRWLACLRIRAQKAEVGLKSKLRRQRVRTMMQKKNPFKNQDS